MNTANRMRMMWVLVITVVTLLAGKAEAQKQWNNTGDGTWNVGAWTPAGVPASSDDVKIGDNVTDLETVTIAAGDPAAVAANLYVGWRDNSPALNGSDGGLIINANSAGDTRLTISGEFGVGSARSGQTIARVGTVTHNNGVVNATGILNIGEYASGNSYTLNGGTLNVGGVLWGLAGLITVTSTVGTMTQGANTTVTVTGNYLSDLFNGSLTRTHTVGSGATLSISGYGDIRGSFKLDNNGGSISVGSYLLVGSGASRHMTAANGKNWSMNGGTFTVGGLFTMGSSSILEMTLSGGTLKVDDLLLGNAASKLTISGSGLLLANNANYTVSEANQDITDGQIVASGMTPDTVIVGGTTYTRIAALPTVTITANDAAASETGPDNGQFTISRDTRTDGALVVNYTLPVSGTATPGNGVGGDYTTTPAANYGARTGSVTIPDGSSSVTVTVTPVDNGTPEGSEDVVLTLATDAAYAVGAPSSATVTIADDDAGNVAPEVDAGANQTVVVNTLPTGNVTLDASLVDDGQPSAATVQWSKQSGPLGSTVTFPGGATALDTTATFDAAGTYVLLLTADDTALQGSDTVTIEVQDNEAPTVIAGSDQSATLAMTVSLAGTLTFDDGLPASPGLTYLWTKDSGPVGGTATFGNSASISTTVTFDQAGEYVLRLTATDGLALSGSDTVTITVRANVAFTSIAGGRFNAAGTWDAPGGVVGPPIQGDTANIGNNHTVTTAAANEVPNQVIVNIQSTGKLQLQDTGSTLSPIHSGATVNVATDGTLEIRSKNTVVGTIHLNGGTLTHNATSDQTAILAASAALYIDSDSFLTPIGAVPMINCPAHGAGKLTLTANALTSSPGVQFASVGSDWSGAWDIRGDIRFNPFGQHLIPGDERVAVGKKVEFVSTTARTIKGTRSGFGTDTFAGVGTQTLGDGSGNGVLSPGDGSGGVGAITMSAYGAGVSHTFVFNAGSTYAVDINGPLNTSYDYVTVTGTGAGVGDVQVVDGAKLVINLWKPTADTMLNATIIDGTGAKLTSGDFTGNITWNNTGGWSGLSASWTGPDLHVEGTYTAPVVTLTANDAAAAEAGPENGQFTVSRGSRTDGDLVVNFTIAGTATPGGDPNDYTLGFSGSGTVDYPAKTGTVTIPDGATSATITVAPYDDPTLENPPETVVVSLAAGAYTLGASSSDTVTIASDEVGNLAPEVDAGTGQSVVVNTLPTGNVTLDGTLIADDGVPVAATFQWSKQSGPLGSTVTFPGGATALDTTATFDAAGTYVLLLTADDTALQGSDTVTIEVQDNEAPTVTAGSDQSATLAMTVSLAGTLTFDDGLPASPGLTYLWTKDSGPVGGTATFGNSASISTTVTFDQAGEYVLRLTATDGLALSGSDTVTITVRANVAFTATAGGRFNAAGTWDAPGGVSGPPIQGDTANIGNNHTVTTAAGNEVPNQVIVNIQSTGKLQLQDPNPLAAGSPISPIHSGATVNVAAGGTLEVQSDNNVVGTFNLNGGALAHNAAGGNSGNLAAGATLNINSDSSLSPISLAATRINCPTHGAGKLTLTADASSALGGIQFPDGSDWIGAWDFQGTMRFTGSFQQRWIPGDVRVAVGETCYVVSPARTMTGTRSGFGTDQLANDSTSSIGDGTGNGVLSPGDGAGGVGTVAFHAFAGSPNNASHLLKFNAGSTYTVDINGALSTDHDSVTVTGTGTGVGNVQVVDGAKLTVNMWTPASDYASVNAKIIDANGARIGAGNFTGNITWNNSSGWRYLEASWEGPDLHIIGLYGPVQTIIRFK